MGYTKRRKQVLVSVGSCNEEQRCVEQLMHIKFEDECVVFGDCRNPCIAFPKHLSFSCVAHGFHCLDVKDEKLKQRLQEREGKQLRVASVPLEPKPTSSAAQVSLGIGQFSLGLQKRSHRGKGHSCIFFNLRKKKKNKT